MSARREMNILVRELRSAGFTVTRTGSGHWMVRPSEGEGSVVLAFSPNSGGFQRSLSRLKRIGFERGSGK